MLEVGFAAGRRLDVKNSASLVECKTARGQGATAFLLAGMSSGGLGLLVGFGESAAENSGSGNDDLGDDAVSLD